jgi:hypothetical protein
MVKRLILTVLLAVGGTGIYVFSSGGGLPATGTTQASSGVSEGGGGSEWHVEYVDGEGNPIPRDSGFRAATRLRVSSNSLLKRIPGLSIKRDADGSGGSDKDGSRRTSGG